MEGTLYRENLARKIKNTPREDRKEVLRSAQSEAEYSYARGSVDYTRKATQRQSWFESIVQEAGSVNDLLERVHSSRAFYFNDVSGIDQPEHIEKKIRLSKETGIDEFLTFGSHTNSRIKELMMQDGGRQESYDSPKEAYFQFITKRLQDFSLSQVQRELIASKLQPEVLGSVDDVVETATLLLNGLPDTQTKYSCAGHDVFEIENTDNSLDSMHGYMAFVTLDDDLVKELSALEEETDAHEVTFEKFDQSGGFGIYFKKKISESWRIAHGKRSLDEIVEESNIKLIDFFGSKLVDEVMRNADSSNIYDFVPELQSRYIQESQQEKPFTFSPNMPELLREVEFLMPHYLAWEEYKEYLLSSEAKADKVQFWKKVEDIVYQKLQAAQ